MSGSDQPSQEMTISSTTGAGQEKRDGMVDKEEKGRRDTWLCVDPGCKKRNSKSDSSCQQCGMSAKMAKDLKGKREGGGRGGGHVGRGMGGGRGSVRGRGGALGGRGWNRNQWERRSKVVDIDTEDPVQNMFGQISKLLDYRQDKRERIIKLSRDITIESKRIIFCLHRINSEGDKATVLGEAECRLMDMKVKLWYYLARELKGEDHYQFIRAYSAGLQEWVEALSFYHYLANDKLIVFEEVETELIFEDKKAKRKIQKASDEEKSDKKELTVEKEAEGKEIEAAKEFDAESSDKGCTEEMLNKNESNLANIMIYVTVPRSEFILGLADLTGELMRNAINSLGSGNMDVCFTLLDILLSMSDGFTRLPKYEAPKDIWQKMSTLKQSCKKVENACYAISVRGSEIPKGHLADIFSQGGDEGHMEQEIDGGEGEGGYFG